MTHHFITLHYALQFSRTSQWVIVIQHGEISQHGEITKHEYIELGSTVPHSHIPGLETLIYTLLLSLYPRLLNFCNNFIKPEYELIEV